MANGNKTAIVTGGAAGMGLAVAPKLIQDGWSVTIVDLNERLGTDVAVSLGKNAAFVQADVTRYSDQVAAFETTFGAYGRIDFVFANAGIAGKADFYDAPTSWPPEPPSMLVEDICLRGVIYTSHLAMQYMRRNKPVGGVIVTTASAASIYASPELPLYAAAKHGVLGLMRSMSIPLKAEGIRVNSILPGAIRTTLHSEDTWEQFPKDDFTPIEEVVDAVLSVVNDPSATGKALEISAGEVFDRAQLGFSNETMRRIMTGKSYKAG